MPRDVVPRLAAGRALGTLAQGLVGPALSWELWERTHSKLVLALIGLTLVVPVIALFVPAGELIDRVDRRRTAALTATGSAIVAAGLAVASATLAPLPIIFALLFVQGCMTVLHSPSASSIVPLVVPREALERANRVTASTEEVARVVAPGIAALALAILPAAVTYSLAGASALGAAVLYRGLPPPRVVAGDPSAVRDWRVGLRFILRSRLLLPALTLDMFAVLFAGATALLPAISTDILGVGVIGFGALRAAPSIGAVLMAMGAAYLPAWKRPGRVLLTVVALYGATTLAFGLSHSFPLSICLLVLMGALDNISVVIRMTLEQMVVPDAIRGRVAAVYFVFIGMSNELGEAESGLAAALVGLVPAIAGGGAIAILVAGVIAIAARDLVRMPPLAELKPGDGER
ncbi:MAG TPA: MFS transporter [Kofleriaceae bacterium]|jgi:MFS family permease